MRTKTTMVCLSIGLAWALSLRGETVRYVALSGDGSDGLTWATARTNLQAAIDDAASADVICIKTGTYVLSSAVQVAGKNLTLRGGYRGEAPELGGTVANPGLTVLDGNAAGRVLVVTNCTAGLIEGLTLRNGLMADHGGGVFMIYVTNTFRNCVIRDNAIYGSEKQGVGLYMTGMEVTFDRCVIRNNLNTSSNGTRYAGALATGAGNLLMRDTEIVGNNARYSGAMMLNGAGTAIFSNCLIRNNWDAGTWGTVSSSKTRTVFNFCTVADNTSGGIYRSGGGTIYVTNSIVWNNGDDMIGTVSVMMPSYSCIEDPDAGAGVIHANPRFILDYYLADDSPCLNAATVTAASAGVDARYARTNAVDAGLADLGYHHVAPFAISTPDLYVKADGGSDGSEGTSPEAPLKTVTRALALAEPGARIHVAAGTYNQANGEAFPVAFKADPVELLGTNAALTVIDATNAGTRAANIYNMGTGTLVSNLTFTGGSNVMGAGIYLRGTSARLVDCVIRNNRLNKGEQRGGGLYVEQGCPAFYGCLIVSNRQTIGTTYGGGGELSGRPRFERCVFFANSCTWQGGAFVFGGESLEMVNCLVASNETSADTYANADGIHVNAGAVQMRQMTFAGNLGKGLVRTAGTVTASNSIFWGNGVDVTGGVSLAYCSVSNGVFTDLGGCTNLAPLFTDPVYCHLQSRKGQYRGGYFTGGEWESGSVNSPLIDRGDPASPYALEPEPNGKRLNPGAYGNTPAASRSPGHSGVIVLVK